VLRQFVQHYGVAWPDLERQLLHGDAADEYAVYEKISTLLTTNVDLAVKMLEAMMNEKEQPSPAFDFVLGNAYYAANQVDRAEQSYRSAVKRYPGFLRAWSNLGVLCYTGGRYAEVGWGLNTSLNDGSKYVSYADDPAAMAFDNSCAWVQDSLTATHGSSRISFDRDISACGVLKDGAFISQAFVALNTSGLEIHLEPTFTLTYQFEENSR